MEMEDWFQSPYDIDYSAPPLKRAVPFTGRKPYTRLSGRSKSSSAYEIFRSYAFVEMQNQGYGRPTSKRLSNVWSKMSAKHRRPWRVLADRLNGDPLLERCAQDWESKSNSAELDNLVLELKAATLGEYPSAMKDLHASLQKLKL